MEHFEETYDFVSYEVTITNNSITYKNKKSGNQYRLPTTFDNSIDAPNSGGMITISFSDRWGSGMDFKHFNPSNKKEMFDFIARGYQVPNEIFQ